MSRPRVLIIGGSDPGGGAGILRDVQTLRDFDVDPVCALTAVTAQTDDVVLDVQWVSADMLRRQVLAVLSGGLVAAVKIGMLGSADNVEVLADMFATGHWPPIVLDPVVAASSGGCLLEPAARDGLLRRLLPRMTLLTPNLGEAGLLLGESPAIDDAERLAQARRLQSLGAASVLLKGGHAQARVARDILLTSTGDVLLMDAPWVATQMRGTGCALSSAIAALLAQGASMQVACEQAKRYVHQRLVAFDMHSSHHPRPLS